MFFGASKHDVEVTTTALNDMTCLESENNVNEEVTIKELAVEVAHIVEARDEQEICENDEEV